MGDEDVVGVQVPRRSKAAVRQLVKEFVESGLGQSEFCRRRGMALNTLKRYLKRHGAVRSGAVGGGLIAVQLSAAAPNRSEPDTSLTIVVSNSRRIEVRRGFDQDTLAQLLAVLEKF